MWLSELVERSGVPTATVKYYLREGLLPAGEPVGATRARYDESHLRRLRLVRALVEVAGLSLTQVRDVLAAMSAESHASSAIGAAHYRLSPPPLVPATPRSRERVGSLIARRHWQVGDSSPHVEAVAAALDTMDAAAQPLGDRSLDVYADAAFDVAQIDVECLLSDPEASGEGAAAFAVLGTLLSEPVLVGLRRTAHEHFARVRLP